MSQPLLILGIAGSLRRQSYNLGLLQAAQELAPADVRVDIATLHDIPLYNADEDGQPHAAVDAFKQRIGAADRLAQRRHRLGRVGGVEVLVVVGQLAESVEGLDRDVARGELDAGAQQRLVERAAAQAAGDAEDADGRSGRVGHVGHWVDGRISQS